MPNPTVTHRGALSMQVCVPSDWTNDQILRLTNIENPAGTELGWFIRREDDPALAGAPERQPCETHPGWVHVMLDC